MPWVPLTDVWVQPKRDWTNSNFTYFSLKLMIIVIAGVMNCNCWMFGGRETAEISLRQAKNENIKRNWEVLLLELRGKQIAIRVLWFGPSPPAEMAQTPRELPLAVLVTLEERVSTVTMEKSKVLLANGNLLWPKRPAKIPAHDIKRDTEESACSWPEHTKVDAPPGVAMILKKRKHWPRTYKSYTATEKWWLL